LRLASFALAAVLLVSVLLVKDPQPAAADGYIFPPGCDAASWNPFTWAEFCWTGIDYNDRGTYVGAIQVIVQDTLWIFGPVDCLFGAGTDWGVRVYQQHEGLGTDGLVGPETWNDLHDQVSFSGIFVPFQTFTWYYWNVGFDSLRLMYNSYFTLPQFSSWFILLEWPQGDRGYVWMNTNDITCFGR
jgi:hypothetical protein